MTGYSFSLMARLYSEAARLFAPRTRFVDATAPPPTYNPPPGMTDLADPPVVAPPGSAAPSSPHEPAPHPRFLADVYENASRCNKCSLCQAACPSYVVNPVEWETARGRVSLIRDAIEGRLELADIADGPLSTCLTCNNCMAACAPGVDTAHIVSRARQELYEQEGHPLRQNLALRGVLTSRAMLRAVHTIARAAERTGALPVMRRTGMTRWLGVAGAVAERVSPIPRRSAYRRARDITGPTAPTRGRLGFVMCCYQNIAAPDATEAALRVLAANRYEVVVPALACTGLPGKTQGDRDAMQNMARNATQILDALTVDALVGDVASCTEHVRDFGRVLDGDPSAVAGGRVGDSMRHATAYLAKAGMVAPLGRLRWTITIDEPCALPIGGSDRQASRALLSEVPGIRIVDLDEAQMCCGGAGVYFQQQPERSDAILARKFERILETGAEVVVTDNISCLLQLRDGARRLAPQLRVLHTFEVLAAALDAAERRGVAGSQI